MFVRRGREGRGGGKERTRTRRRRGEGEGRGRGKTNEEKVESEGKKRIEGTEMYLLLMSRGVSGLPFPLVACAMGVFPSLPSLPSLPLGYNCVSGRRE